VGADVAAKDGVAGRHGAQLAQHGLGRDPDRGIVAGRYGEIRGDLGAGGGGLLGTPVAGANA
jgi:hypothetical protein